jgi:chromosome segregation ATPase
MSEDLCAYCAPFYCMCPGMQNEARNLRARVEELEQAAEVRNATGARVRDQLFNTRAQLAASQTAGKSLRARVKELEREASENSHAASAQAQRAREAEARVKELEAENADLRSNYTQASMLDLQEEVTRLEEELNGCRRAVRHWRNKAEDEWGRR